MACPLRRQCKKISIWAKIWSSTSSKPNAFSRPLRRRVPSSVQLSLAPTFSITSLNRMCVFLTLCDRSFNKKLAYSFLEDLSQEFYNMYGHKISTASRPYSFIEFDTYIQKAKKKFTDTRGHRNLSNLNTELQDVQRIMVQNIDDVLQRGVVMSELDRKANDLSVRASQYRKEATSLNATSWVAIGAGLSVLFIVFFFWYKFLL